MLKIRLKRFGRKNEAFFRVVVMQDTAPRDGRALDELGVYNPRTQPSVFEVDADKVRTWIEKGAQPTATVAQQLAKQGIIEYKKKGSKLGQQRPPKKEREQE